LEEVLQIRLRWSCDLKQKYRKATIQDSQIEAEVLKSGGGGVLLHPELVP